MRAGRAAPGIVLAVLLCLLGALNVRGEAGVSETGRAAAGQDTGTEETGWAAEQGTGTAEQEAGTAEQGTGTAEQEAGTAGQDTGAAEQNPDGDAGQIETELLEDMDLSEVQAMIDGLLGEDSFSFSEALKRLLEGEEVFSKEAVLEFLHGLFFFRLEQEKSTFLKLLLLVLLGAVFSNFAQVFDSGQIGEVSFYVVYLLLFMLLMDTFSALSGSLETSLKWLAEFMQVLSPAYFLAVAAASGAGTAAVFYQGVLLLVWLIQWLLLTVLLPAANIYLLLRLVNDLSREEMLGKLAELLETVISWGLRTLLGLVVGLQVVKNLVAPVMDALKRSAIGRTASAIPGVGNAVNMVTELVVTSAVLVRNSLGVVILAALVLAGAGPVIHYGLMSLSYRLLGAISQPVSDRRIVGALTSMGEGCGILLRILLTAEVLCMLTFVILMAGLGGSS